MAVTLRVMVRDSSGTAVGSALVTATTGASIFSGATSEMLKGLCIIDNLPVGSYLVTAQKNGGTASGAIDMSTDGNTYSLDLMLVQGMGDWTVPVLAGGAGLILGILVGKMLL